MTTHPVQTVNYCCEQVYCSACTNAIFQGRIKSLSLSYILVEGNIGSRCKMFKWRPKAVRSDHKWRQNGLASSSVHARISSLNDASEAVH